MNRLQKKCFIATTAFHGLLLGILLFGSALMPKEEDLARPSLKVYSADKISDLLSSGGDANANVPTTPPASAPPAPVAPAIVTPVATPPVKPAPAPVVVKPPPPTPRTKVEPPKVRVEPPKVIKATKLPDPKLTQDLLPKPSPHKVVIDPENLKPVVRKTSDLAQQQQAAAAAAAAAEQKRKAQKFDTAYQKIGKDLSSKVQVELAPGVGTPGELSVNYNDLIVSKYKAAWAVPPNLDDSVGAAVATITIARDGSVISARITRPSGNPVLDRSVANVLETVTTIEPFPAGFNEQQRTVTVQFDPHSKRQTG